MKDASLITAELAAPWPLHTAALATIRRCGGISDTLIDETDTSFCDDSPAPDEDDYAAMDLAAEFASLSAFDELRASAVAAFSD